jgi:hypothetical protein
MWFRKKLQKELKAVRISVHMADGSTVVHYATTREIRSDGGLSIIRKRGDERLLVADYTAGSWLSLSIGKRCVRSPAHWMPMPEPPAPSHQGESR